MKIIPLSEGAFTIDKTKQFIPFIQGTDNLQERSIGSLLVEVQPFVVITEKDVLLLDTGLGFSQDGSLQLHQNLLAAGIDPATVTKVLMSHLHKDHAGGVSMVAGGGEAELAFPHATYYLQEEELAFAFSKGLPSYIPAELECLKTAANVQFLHGDSTIDGYISSQVTGGHSPFHQVFWIREADEIIFFGGDDAPQLSQMKNRFIAKYDYDGKKCMELRKQWWQQGATENWTFLFYHDIKTPIGKNVNLTR